MQVIKKIISTILFCNPKDLDTVLLHIPVGIINAGIGIYLAKIGFPVIGLAMAGIFGYGFIKYQAIEKKTIHDRCFPDIQGWLWGIGIACIFIVPIVALLF